MDHYPGRSDAEYARPFGALPGDPVAWPEGSGQRVFAYLRDQAFNEPLLRGLAMKNVATIAYAPRLPAACVDSLAGTSVVVVASPVDLRPLLKTCDAAIHHGGHVAACLFLLAGVPTLTIPLTLEQAVTGRRCRDLGVGLDAPPDDLPAIAGGVENLLNDDRYVTTAQSIAQRYSKTADDAGLHKVVDAVERPNDR